LYRRLGGPQGRSGRLRKISPPPGFDPRTVQPIASRYTDFAIPAHVIILYALHIQDILYIYVLFHILLSFWQTFESMDYAYMYVCMFVFTYTCLEWVGGICPCHSLLTNQILIYAPSDWVT
jgi:hypothetical protein